MLVYGRFDFAVLGGFIASKLVSRLKNKEKALRVSSIFYIVGFCALALIPKISLTCICRTSFEWHGLRSFVFVG